MKTILTHCRHWLCAAALVVVWLYSVPAMDKLKGSFPADVLQAWADERQRRADERALDLVCRKNGEAVPVYRNGVFNGCAPRRSS